MTPETTLQFADDISIVVPDDLNLITTYVLQEQGDWFEDEIKFVRKVVGPGQKVIDIGANYGVFTLTLAKAVGATGQVWAFEPASLTAGFLRKSVSINQWGHITIDTSALSDREGDARLSLNQNAELNELIRGDDASGAYETVRLTTLDAAARQHAWRDIDLLKIDAEGEEEAIIRGGHVFFRQESPLVQYEIKAAQGVNLGLTRAFATIGYDSYRLVPGLGILVPFDPQGLVDDYLLNLFCCKPDRAKALAAAGHLVLPSEAETAESASELLVRARATGQRDSQKSLELLPYGKLLTPLWSKAVASEASQQMDLVLTLYNLSTDGGQTARDRFHALRMATHILTELCNRQATLTRLMTLARLARQFGARKIAVLALHALIEEFRRRSQLDLSEPFLAAEASYDTLDLRGSVADWFVSCALEAMERNARYSSFYAGRAGIPGLEAIEAIGYGSAEMARRLALLRKRFGS